VIDESTINRSLIETGEFVVGDTAERWQLRRLSIHQLHHEECARKGGRDLYPHFRSASADDDTRSRSRVRS